MWKKYVILPNQPTTFLIIFLTSVAFIIEYILGKGNVDNPNVLVKMGAEYGPMIANGEHYRFIMPMFLHNGWEHFLMNMLILYFVAGMLAEEEFGFWRYLIIYFGGGFFANMVSYVIEPYVLTVGASTSIFALIGAELAFGVRYHKDKVTQSKTLVLVAFVTLNFLLSLGHSEIDEWGHLGGFIGGVLLSLIVGTKVDKMKTFPPGWRTMAVMLLLITISLVSLLIIGKHGEANYENIF